MKELRLRNFLMLTGAGFINAFGVTVFLSPVKLYDSGISGAFITITEVADGYKMNM